MFTTIYLTIGVGFALAGIVEVLADSLEETFGKFVILRGNKLHA